MFGWQCDSSGGEIRADSCASFVRNQSEFPLFRCKLEGGAGLGMCEWDGQGGVDGALFTSQIKI